MSHPIPLHTADRLERARRAAPVRRRARYQGMGEAHRCVLLQPVRRSRHRATRRPARRYRAGTLVLPGMANDPAAIPPDANPQDGGPLRRHLLPPSPHAAPTRVISTRRQATSRTISATTPPQRPIGAPLGAANPRHPVRRSPSCRHLSRSVGPGVRHAASPAIRSSSRDRRPRDSGDRTHPDARPFCYAIVSNISSR